MMERILLAVCDEGKIAYDSKKKLALKREASDGEGTHGRGLATRDCGPSE